MMDRYERDVVRARVRDLERNSDMANAMISARVRNTVGKGITLQAKTDDPDFNAQAEALWKKWCRARNCDVTRSQNFNQMLRMAVRRKMVDGGIIFLKCYTSDGLVPFKLQTLEVDELCLSQTTPKKKGNKVISGVEYNSYNRAVGYWFQRYSADGMTVNDPEYYDAERVIFYFSKKRPSQVREISDLAPTVSRIRDVNEYMDAVAMKERVAACLSAFITRQNPASGFGRANAAAADSRDSYDGRHLAPGMIFELGAGDDVKVVSPGNSSGESESFLKTQERLMAAGQGMSYEVVSRDMSQTNYSSARQGLIEDDETFAEEVESLKEVIMDEVYETFLISCEVSGLFGVRDFWENKESYMSHTWVSAPKRWIDPAKEANATKIALDSKQKSFKDVCAENGKDWQEQIDDMAEVAAYAASKGIELGGNTNGQNKTT